MSTQDHEGFEAYARALTLQHARRLATIVAISALLSWPIDFVLFPGNERVLWGLALARVLGSASAALGAASMHAVGARLSDPLPLVVGTMLACSAATSAGFTMAGGLALNTFQSVPFAAMVTAPMIWPLRRRIVVTLAVMVVFFGTFVVVGAFELDPGYLEHPALGTTVANAGLGVLTSVVLGEMATRLNRKDFRSAQALRHRAEALAKQEAELVELNEELEDQVLARTHELSRLAAHIEVNREEERRRIARELHDETGQLLTALRMELSYARKRSTGNAELVQSLDRLEDLVNQTLTSTRELVHELRPRILDDYGLGAGAEWMLERFAAQSALDVDWEVDLAGGEVTGEHATATFRILQESLTNVARHAKANKVTVRLKATTEEVLLEVTDDGIGIADRGDDPGGFGVLGMRERARALGGSFEISSGRSSGTLVSLRLPRDSS